MDVIGFELDLIVLLCFELPHTYELMIIYRAGVIGFEVGLIVLQVLCTNYPSILKWSSHVLTAAHIDGPRPGQWQWIRV